MILLAEMKCVLTFLARLFGLIIEKNHFRRTEHKSIHIRIYHTEVLSYICRILLIPCITLPGFLRKAVGKKS